MKKFRISRIALIFVIVATLIIGSSSISFATTVSKVNYLGGGSVELGFAKKTTYKSLKIEVRDNTGEKYKTAVKSKKSTSLRFIIYNYQTGRSYRVSVSGLKDGSTATSFQIISKKKAIAVAKRKAKTVWKAGEFSNVECESATYKGTAVWKVKFESGGSSYTYWITQQTGFMLRSERN